jgi:hypothetical protein
LLSRVGGVSGGASFFVIMGSAIGGRMRNPMLVLVHSCCRQWESKKSGGGGQVGFTQCLIKLFWRNPHSHAKPKSAPGSYPTEKPIQGAIVFKIPNTQACHTTAWRPPTNPTATTFFNCVPQMQTAEFPLYQSGAMSS